MTTVRASLLAGVLLLASASAQADMLLLGAGGALGGGGGTGVTVATPANPNAGAQMTVSGTYTGTVTAIDVEFDAGGYNPVSSPTIGGGSFSFTTTAPAAPTGNHTVSVRDHNNTSASGTSGIFTSIALPADAVAATIHYFVSCARGVSAAYSTGTNKACDIKRASDSTTQTFNILNTGNFDTAGAATFCAATTCNVTRQYNQVAASFPDLVQTGAGLIPLLSFNCINTTLPCVNFYTGGSGQRYMASANPASGDAQPTTIGGAYSDNALASIDVFVSHGFGIFGTGTNSRHLFAGAASGNFTSTDNTVHAVSVVFNGASSSANVDGVLTSSLNAGTTFGFADPAGPIQISDSSSTVGIGYEGEFFEATGAMSSGDRAAYRTSAQDYYATP